MKTYRFKIYGHEYEAKVVRREEEEIVINVNGQDYKAYLEPKKRTLKARPTPKLERPKAVHGEGTKMTSSPSEVRSVGCVKAPLPGQIIKVSVKEGDEVKAGDTVILMEAMKMQNAITAPTPGTVQQILVKEGDSVLEGQDLIKIG